MGEMADWINEQGWLTDMVEGRREEDEEERETIVCEQCEKEILISKTLAHLVDHVAIHYKYVYDDETESFVHIDSGQIHDLIVGHYNDEDLDLTNAIDIIEDITDRFDRVRIIIVYKYAPFNTYLLFSKDEGYYVFTGDHEQTEFGFDLQNGINGFIKIVNQLLKFDRNYSRDKVEIIGNPTNVCQFVSYHLKVPGDWLGVPVAVKKKGGLKSHLTRPVKCGNSVHVTIPGKWSDRKVIVMLAPLNNITDLREMDDDDSR